jgi:hypothetical protein
MNRLATIAVAGLGIGLAGCSGGATEPVPDLAGVYPFALIDGHAPGWHHPIAGEDCTVAFMGGSLTITTDDTFTLDLEYDFRCFEGNGSDGSGRLLVAGSGVRASGDTFILSGCGPPVGFAENCPRWGLDVRPVGDNLTVRFTGLAGDYWNHPELTMGPRRQ